MDAVLLFPPGASQLASAWASTIQLGSWLMADPGPDYGARGLIESVEAQNALRDGGTFAHRRGVIRKMALPLMLNTPSPAGWETALRKAVTPGAIVAVQPEGVPSAQAVYFDIIDGRWEPDYNIFHNRVGVRKGTLYLDTQPWGYWPTEILLASAASIGWMGQLPVNGASVIGDVPPLAHITIAPTVASSYASAAAKNYWPDMAAVSLSGRPSFTPYIAAASFLPGFRGQVGIGNVSMAASLTGDKFAPGSQAIVLTATTGGAGPRLQADTFVQFADTNLSIPSALEPAYRGRFRVFAFARAAPSGPNPWWLTIDSDSFLGSQVYSGELASANALASVYSVVNESVVYSASPAYGTFDMGEITLPPAASGAGQGVRLRAWAGYPSVSTGSQTQLFFAGLYLVPMDDAAGILTRGLITPTPIDAAGLGGLELNGGGGFGGGVWVTIPASKMLSADGLAYYRGVSPRLGASVNQLILMTGDRQYSLVGGAQNSAAGTTIVAQANVEYAQVSVSYRPTFQFLAGG